MGSQPCYHQLAVSCGASLLYDSGFKVFHVTHEFTQGKQTEWIGKKIRKYVKEIPFTFHSVSPWPVVLLRDVVLNYSKVPIQIYGVCTYLKFLK